MKLQSIYGIILLVIPIMKKHKRSLTREMRTRVKVPKGYSRHHRIPTSRGGPNDDWNISIVTKVQHQSWHNIFDNLDPTAIAEIISQRWIDPRYKLICVAI